MTSQKEILASLTDKQLLIQVYVTQGLLLGLSFVIGFFVFDNREAFWALFQNELFPIVLIGGGLALAVIMLDVMLERLLPAEWLDDGGLNERLFRSLTTPRLLLVCATVAVAEEIFFRGVLQTAFGLVAASLLFAVVHGRYLPKPWLFGQVIAVSFLLGLTFEWTGNLLITIFAHFLIDVVVGMLIRARAQKDMREVKEV
ncbi:CPBP family intramembrane glutamic endopeptidase [Halalkalibacter oceani]|uniref:CPBP family intramembrane glutamic endopeptidase n=1 Tax=Halalkalibacter oceani TaxID=1653776 RepID=UPI003396C4A3